MIAVPPQIGGALTLTLALANVTMPPSGVQLQSFVLSAKNSSGLVYELADPMTFTLTYGVGQVTGVNVPYLYARSAVLGRMNFGWEKIPIDVDFGARRVTAQETRMTEYVLVAAPAMQVYVPALVK